MMVCSWYQCRHSDPKAAVKDGRSFSAAEDDKTDVYPLQLRLSVPRVANLLGVRITKKVCICN